MNGGPVFRRVAVGATFRHCFVVNLNEDVSDVAGSEIGVPDDADVVGAAGSGPGNPTILVRELGAAASAAKVAVTGESVIQLTHADFTEGSANPWFELEFVLDSGAVSAGDEVAVFAKIPVYKEGASGDPYTLVQHVANILVMVSGEGDGQVCDDLVAIKGSGFSTSTDSLAAIRAEIDAEVAPRVATVTGYSDLAGVGFLQKVVEDIRIYVDEPGASSKYSNDKLLDRVGDSFTGVMRELNQGAKTKPWCEWDFTLAARETRVALPPCISQVLEIQLLDAAGGNERGELRARGRHYLGGPLYSITGQTLVFANSYSSPVYCRVVYVPTGDVQIHEATAASHTSTSITAPSTPTAGNLDKRLNAYGGYILRVLSATWVGGSDVEQERLVTGYDNETLTFTLDPALDPAPDVGDLVYEVVPTYLASVGNLVALYVAKNILSSIGDNKRFRTLAYTYKEALRALRLTVQKQHGRLGRVFSRRQVPGRS